MLTSRTFRNLPGVLLVIVLLSDRAPAQSLEEGVDKVTAFSNDLLHRLFGPLATQNANLVIGPFGIASNLAMLLEGSSGKTRQEILTALNLTLDDIAPLRIGFKAYCQLFLDHSSNPDAAGAFNAVAVVAGFQTQTAFNNILSQYYCASRTSAANTTDEPSIRLESHAGVMAHWKDFEKLAVYTFLSHQALMPFTRRDGISNPTPMIPQVGVFKAATWSNSTAILLPLETDLVDFLLIMPEKSKKINSIAKTLTTQLLYDIIRSMQSEELEIFLPQLTTVSKHLDIKPLLQTAGISLAFDQSQADLTRASDKTHRTFLQDISQDAYFSTSFTSLNAVSGVSTNFRTSNRRKRSANKVFFNKPFLFFVLHKDTRLVLLAGKIEDPAQVPK